MSNTALFDSAPSEVSIYEVSPRDGLQNENATVPLAGKLRLLDALIAAGVRRIEMTSFVSPRWIPQLADADELAAIANDRFASDDVALSALCPNGQGLARAKSAGMKEIAVFVSASETHNKKNVNKTIDATLGAFEETVGPARDAGDARPGLRLDGVGLPVRGGSPGGAVDPDREAPPRHGLLPGVDQRHDRQRDPRASRGMS